MCKESVSEEDQDAIEEMMEKIEDNTCLRFRLMIIRIITVNMLIRMMMVMLLMILPYQRNRKEAAENPGDQNR